MRWALPNDDWYFRECRTCDRVAPGIGTVKDKKDLRCSSVRKSESVRSIGASKGNGDTSLRLVGISGLHVQSANFYETINLTASHRGGNASTRRVRAGCVAEQVRQVRSGPDFRFSHELLCVKKFSKSMIGFVAYSRTIYYVREFPENQGNSTW